MKIADFGFAARFPTINERRTTFCGTIDYISPEIVTGGGIEPDANGD